MAHEMKTVARSKSQNFPCNELGATIVEGRVPVLPSSHSLLDNLTVNSSSPRPGLYVSTASPSTSSVNIAGRRLNEGAPKSPKTGRTPHCIPHVWAVKRCKNPNKGQCAVCYKSLGFLVTYEKCRSCKQSVHTDCKARVNDNCGLTPKHFKEFLTQMVIKARQDNWAPNMGVSKSMTDMPMMPFMAGQNPLTVDSSSSTSVDSSAPSTPAMFLHANVPSTSAMPSPAVRLIDRSSAPRTVDPIVRSTPLFTFPDVSDRVPTIVFPPNHKDDSYVASVTESCDSNSTLKSGLKDDEKNKQELTDSNDDTTRNEQAEGHKWDRRSWNMFTIRGHGATSWRELTIPFKEESTAEGLRITSLVGRGRFGEVYEADHFGPVAIKLLDMNHVEEAKRLEVFKQETACYQNARHDYLALFYGYTMDKDRLGVVMELIKGRPLHALIHDEETFVKLDFNDIIDFAKQLCEGMSYLHAKRILHKDLRSKNVFIKDLIKDRKHRKLTITDFGIFNSNRLSHPHLKNGFLVPQNWLCYTSPEVVRKLSENLEPLPFSEKSDVYAFGTIWYELMTYRFPFQGFSPESILWQVGVGMKSALCNVNVCQEALLLMRCWAFTVEDRSSFAEILGLLATMPRNDDGPMTLRRSASFSA